MQKQSVSSSDIASIGYDSKTQTPEIEFHSGGTYHYSNVPESVYGGLMSAGSHGKYFHQHIKNIYPSNKIQ